MFKTYSSSSSLVITSRWFATSHQVAPVYVRLVYCGKLLYIHGNVNNKKKKSVFVSDQSGRYFLQMEKVKNVTSGNEYCFKVDHTSNNGIRNGKRCCRDPR